MKNDLKHIDKLFLNSSLDGETNFSANKGWRAMRLRLFFTELLAFNFVNVNWNYVIYPGLILLFLSFSVFYFGAYESESLEIAGTDFTNDSFSAPEEIKNSIAEKVSHQNQSKKPNAQELKKPFDSENSNLAQVVDQNTYAKTQPELLYQPQATNSIDNREGEVNEIQLIKPKHLNISLCIYDESFLEDLPLDNNHTYPDNSNLAQLEQPKDKISYFLMGLSAGTIFNLDEAEAIEKVRQPVYYAGLNFRYNLPHFFVETALEFSKYQSTINTTYQYDSLLGTLPSFGYEIVETINDEGEIVLERHYYSEMVEIYDTLHSNDRVAIESNTTILAIPVLIGTKILHRKNFYLSVFAGINLKLLLSQSQSQPQYGSNSRQIIDYESSPTLNINPEFEFQAGLLFGYQVSNRFSLEIKTSYNHILGASSEQYQYSESNIKFSFGINYTF